MLHYSLMFVPFHCYSLCLFSCWSLHTALLRFLVSCCSSLLCCFSLFSPYFSLRLGFHAAVLGFRLPFPLFRNYFAVASIRHYRLSFLFLLSGFFLVSLSLNAYRLFSGGFSISLSLFCQLVCHSSSSPGVCFTVGLSSWASILRFCVFLPG